MSWRRWIALSAVALLLVGAAIGYFSWYRPTRFAVDIGAGVLAKQMCSCVFVAGREEDACRADQLDSMDPIRVQILSEPTGVRAYLLGLGERTAIYRAGLGCTLQ